MRRGGKKGMDPFKAGVIAIIATVLFTYGGFTKFQNPFAGHFEVEAVFPSAATSLKAGDPVRIAGVEVGKVAEMTKGPGGTAIATLHLEDEGRPLHRDAEMKIRPRLFLEGNFFVDVSPGTPAAGTIDDGGTIPLAQNAVAVQLDEVLGSLEKTNRRDLQGTIENLARVFDEGGAEALNESFKHWEGAFSSTAVVAEAARGERPGDLTRFIRNQAVISGALASRERELADLVTNFARTVTTLAANRDDLGRSLRALDSTLATARPALADIRTALPPLEDFASALRPALRVAPGAIDDMLPFVRTTSELLDSDELPALVNDLRPAVTGLRSIDPRLRAVFGITRRISTCVSRNIVPTVNKKLDDGALSVDRTVWQEIAAFPVGLTSAGGNFDANGSVIRYHAGGGTNLVTTAQGSLGDLVSLTPEPILGARPRYTPNKVPPFAPEVPCEGQELPDLRAEAAPAPAQQRSVKLSGARRGDLVSKATTRLKGLDSVKDLRSALRAARERDAKGASK